MTKPLKVFEAPLSGVSLVEASAGTGKTYSITSLYVRAILEENLQPAQILVMTYTEAATAELKFRLRNRLKESLKAIADQDPGSDEFLKELLSQSYEDSTRKLQTAIDTFDEAAVFTIHGFCSRLLTEYSLQFDVSPTFELLTDDSEVLQDCVDAYWRTFIRSASEDSDKMVLLDYLTDEGFGPDELKSAVEEIFKHPESKLEPSNLNTEDLFDRVSALETKFKEVKRLWEQEGEEIEKIYFSGHLSGTIYRKESHDNDWAILQDWLKNPKAKISYSERLEKFGLKLSRSGKKSAPEIPEFDLCKAIDEYCALADELKLLKPAFIIESVEQIQQSFQEHKKFGNLLSYNDLLEVVKKGIKNDNSGVIANTLSTKYPLALVDEFQDTDPIQYGIFKQIYAGRADKALFMIGDPKQAIYGFRGADIFTYLEAREDAADTQSYTLDFNYRSNAKMIAGVNSLFKLSKTPFLIDGLRFNPAHFPSQKEDVKYLVNNLGDNLNPLQCILLSNNRNTNKRDINSQVYEAVTNEIIDLLSGDYQVAGEKVQEKDIAILLRTGFQGEEMQARLREKGLKSVLKSRSSVFSTREARELFLVLKAIQKISYEPGIRAALATELLGYNASEIQNLLADEAGWAKIISKFIQLKEEWDNKGVEPAIEQLFLHFKTRQLLATRKDAERRITNLMHLSELLAKAQRENRLYGKALLKWFYKKINEEKSDSEDDQLRLESDENLIQISTIHAAKGLQYPIVFCPFLWDSGLSIKKGDILKFYKERSVHVDVSSGVNHKKRADFEKEALLQEMAEEVRLAYVALTRSVAACYLFLPDYKKLDESALASIVTGGRMDAKTDFESIKTVLHNSNEIEVRDSAGPKSVEFELDKEKDSGDLVTAEFKRTDIFHYPRMLSYTSLAGGGEHEDSGHDYDAVYDLKEADFAQYNKFGFPRGANAGTCLHTIFEDIIFDSANDSEIAEVVSHNLEYHGFIETWEKPVLEWIKDVLNHNFKNPAESLSSLKKADVLKEMEFYFPVEQVHADELWNLLRKESPRTEYREQVSGFMKGFIDLIFKCGDKYYILDYKSNHLGNEPTDYGQAKLKQAMWDAGYDLQYHIYTLALHRFFKHRIKGYDYDQHFGGVLYLFLRGVEPGEPGSGVYFDKPKLRLIEELDGYFRQGGTP